MKYLVVLFGALWLAACGAAETTRPDFRTALDAHLAAIAAKDFDAYKPTVTSGEDLHLIFPDGSVIETTQGVFDFHEEWFADSNWRMDPDVVKVMEGEDMAAALLKYDYRDTPEGDPRASWLILVFGLENGQWRLIHDQNTRIIQQTSSEDV
ncbi:YybH family protein [Marinicaulis aureus]|uniref:YybH family protein n=1 Tax=Hyphococcus aureus TaxID=2666033 RepID=A0ABW1KS98_9PROT